MKPNLLCRSLAVSTAVLGTDGKSSRVANGIARQKETRAVRFGACVAITLGILVLGPAAARALPTAHPYGPVRWKIWVGLITGCQRT